MLNYQLKRLSTACARAATASRGRNGVSCRRWWNTAAVAEQVGPGLTARAEAIQAAGDGVAVKTDRYLGGSRRVWDGSQH